MKGTGITDIDEGQLVEGWMNTDLPGLMQQIGGIPESL